MLFDFYVLACVSTIVETTSVSRETPLDWGALKISSGKPGVRMPCSEAVTSIKHWHTYILLILNSGDLRNKTETFQKTTCPLEQAFLI
jgi:hypothetical protein